MVFCFLLSRLLMLSFCLSACLSVWRSFLWIMDNRGMTLWWVSPWVGMVHDWSDTRKMKRKMRVYISWSAITGLLGRKVPNRHIHFNNSVYISPRILLKKPLESTLIFLAMPMTIDKLLKMNCSLLSVFSSDHTQRSRPDIIYHCIVM